MTKKLAVKIGYIQILIIEFRNTIFQNLSPKDPVRNFILSKKKNEG